MSLQKKLTAFKDEWDEVKKGPESLYERFVKRLNVICDSSC